MTSKLLLVVLNLFGCLLTLASKSHPITTQLSAKWSVTPIQLEIAEYLADENVNLFWDYVDQLLKLPIAINELENDEIQYKKAIEAAERLLGPAQTNLLKLSLSMHSLSPKVQAHLQIAREVLKHGDCDSEAFANVGGKVVCDVEELKSVLRVTKSDTKVLETYTLDHIFPGSANNSVTVVFYATLGSNIFKEFHSTLKPLAESGNLKYVFRHYVKNLSTRKLRLSGYGVDLHLKSTEYKSQDDNTVTDRNVQETSESVDNEIEGFEFSKLKERFPQLSHSLDRFKNHLMSKGEEIAPLKAWEFQELGLQAAVRIASIQGEEALQILKFTAQNFPTQAKSLLGIEVSEDFKKEMKSNIELLGRNLNLQPPDAALFLNGLFFDADTLDTATLVDTLRSEFRVLDGLNKIHLRGKTSGPLLALDLSSSNMKDFAIDIRDTAILWINDMETDTAYKRWPSSVMDLLRPTFPGMMRNIRKNLFNLVLIIDPITPEGRDIVKLAESFVVHNAPVRLGFVFDTKRGNDDFDLTDDYRGAVCAFNYVYQKKGTRESLGYLTDLFAAVSPKVDVKLSDIKKQLQSTFSRLSSSDVDDILGEDSDFDYGRALQNEFAERLGMKTLPQALLNGVPLAQSTLNSDDFEETVLQEIMQQTPSIQKAVYRGELTDNDLIVDYLMKQPHIMPRLNEKILSTEEPNFMDLNGKPYNDIEDITTLSQLSNVDLTATLLNNLKYFGGKHTHEKFMGNKMHFLTVWVIGDLNTKGGKEMLKNALEYMLSTNGVRVSFIPNADGEKAATVDLKTDLNAITWSALNTLSSEESSSIVMKWLKQTNTKYDIPSDVEGFLRATELHLKMLRVYCQRVLKMKASESNVIANGRNFGSFEQNGVFNVEDFSLLDRFNTIQYIDKIKKALKDASVDEDLEINSDTILKLVSLLVPRQQTKSRFTIPPELQEHHTVVNLAPKHQDSPYFDVVAVLDPASRGAQKLAPILILLRNVINCNLKLILCAVDKHSDMPVKTFYRFVVEPEIQFTAEGKMAAGPQAKFIGLPANPLLTQSMNVPENWLVEVVRSVYDLDNIRLSEINGPVHSEYELEYLLLEGHCFDTATGAPPRGLQITLGTEQQPIIVDTIVMANLGYFQLKANPGAWILKLRHGKSSDIYDITNAEGLNTIHSLEGTRVIISSMRSHVLKLRVTKKPGQQSADLLSDDKEPGGIWNSITSSIVGKSDSSDDETINIFSVASGHLYERLLRIMMLSLLKHTKSPVKFWFLKNYLSPQFIDFLPHMSKEYNFNYELVQYKWPRWLHQQTEKQRIIWGYKILFLDVLFPLDVKKIIFVDADQIVRADMKELYTMDLGGAPYAYTPFCDSRKEMEGFRFWKQGYWRNHLQGRRYHISALYVVDLKRFRRIAAGDRIRGQYQALSQDPNSLSNLDQDLPNNMIHQVAVKSLPQEWLWCETWCSDESLKHAKTIDLCNNPLTKEAKLTAAQRIVPEWKDYDTEIKRLQAQIDEEIEHEESNNISVPAVHSEL